MAWYDYFKIFSYAFNNDPIELQDKKYYGGGGTPQKDALPDVRAMGDGSTGRGSVRLRDSSEFVDLNTVTNRTHRYTEYERLRSVPEIENAMTVMADEACLSGDTLVATPSYDGGFRKLEWLAENMANEKFLVYCYDFEKDDYSLGWAFNPRFVKEEETIKVMLDDGSHFIATTDHRILLKNKQWVNAGDLEDGSELMPFYRISARPDLTGSKVNQFPRIYTNYRGWIGERQFIDEWRTNRPVQNLQEANKIARMVVEGLGVRKIKEITGRDFKTIMAILNRAGFSNRELKWLANKSDRRVVVGVVPNGKIKVYDLSVEKHENFCTNWGVVHNCQKDENNRVFQVICKNQEIKEELEFMLFHRKMLNLDQKKIWNRAKNLFIKGDDFLEIIINPDDPKKGVIKIAPLPPETMYRIESTKGRLIEFQQSKEGPDYDSLSRVEVTQATDADLLQAKAIRFTPEQIVHIRIGDDRETFYPYGVSLIEPARGPAHQLRLMEDAMVMYRLTRAPERRVFYIDVQQMPPGKAEMFVERLKDQLKKKKVPRNSGGLDGASNVEERWHPQSADEDFWIPIRPNAATRVETLPGAENLGEIDDTVYFRNKLFIALNFPKNYFNNEDVQSTRISLSAQDIKFARMIERLQSHMEDGFWDICDRHLKLRGYPEELYEDLEIKMTPPSDWRELSRGEILSARIQNAGALKGSQLLSDYDILTLQLKYGEDDSKKMLARLKQQKLEELKLQVLAQNPSLLGVGLPGEDEQQVGTEPTPENPMLGGENQPPPPEADPMAGGDVPAPPTGPQQPPNNGGAAITLPDAPDDLISKYDLEIKNFAQEMDEEEVDYSQE